MAFCTLGPIWSRNARLARWGCAQGRSTPFPHAYRENRPIFQNKGFPCNQCWIMCRWTLQDRWAPPEHPRDTSHGFSARCLRLPIRPVWGNEGKPSWYQLRPCYSPQNSLSQCVIGACARSLGLSWSTAPFGHGGPITRHGRAQDCYENVPGWYACFGTDEIAPRLHVRGDVCLCALTKAQRIRSEHMAKTAAHYKRSRSLGIQFRYHVFRPRRQASSGLPQGGYARSFPTYPLLTTPILVQNRPCHTMRILKNSPGPMGPRIHPQEA